MQRVWALVCLGLFAIGLVGCGSSTGSVSGQVSYQGKTVPSGSVTFVTDKGEAAGTSPIKDGAYTIHNVPVGKVKIGVSTPPAGGTPPPGVPAAGTSGTTLQVPDKYRTPDQSGLTLDVKGGEQSHNINLE
jgi:hypothetical protein